jgi:hypothetical protein
LGPAALRNGEAAPIPTMTINKLRLAFNITATPGDYRFCARKKQSIMVATSWHLFSRAHPVEAMKLGKVTAQEN